MGCVYFSECTSTNGPRIERRARRFETCQQLRNDMNSRAFVPVSLSLTVALMMPLAFAEDFVCHWAQSPIVIDGIADDKAWSHATLIDGFRIPGSLTPLPQTATRARLLWDRQYLYFYAELEDHDLFADITEHDGLTWNNDVFEIF